MRTFPSLVLISILQIALPAQGSSQLQDPNNLLGRVSHLTVQDTLLADALGALILSSGVSIAFSPDLLPPEHRVSCLCDDLTVGEALSRIVEGTSLTYETTRTLIRIVPPPAEAPAAREAGTLAGTVSASGTGFPVVNAMIRLADGRGTLSDIEGQFLLVGIPPGEYDLTVTGMGWVGTTLDGIQIRRDETTVVGLTLQAEVISLAEMVVAPSTYGILKDPLSPAQAMSRERMRALPQLGEDLFRVADRLPGISTNDFTARLFVRGSRADEVLTMMDGLELFEPYHLKQWDAVLSILDVETVGNVDLITGGFPVEYGDRSAGVFSLNSVEPRTDQIRTSLGLSFMNVSLRNEGGFDDGRGSWMFTGRRGFMDVVFNLAGVDDDFHPAYYDVFGKVQYEIKPGHRISARVLHAGDDLTGSEEGDHTKHDDLYGSTYLWATWDGKLSDALSGRTIVSGSRISKDRHGEDFQEDGALRVLDVRDRQETSYLGLKSDWAWVLSPRTLLKSGFELRQGWAEYDYDLWRDTEIPNFSDPTGPPFYPVRETKDFSPEPSGYTAAAYLGQRLKISESLTTDIGLRYLYASYTGEGNLRPRVSAALEITPSTTLRGAWGYYSQAQGLHELQVADGDTLFHPAQDAEHRILGLEQSLFGHTTVRVEAFQRTTSNPFPEYRNLSDAIEAVWEEGPGDRFGFFPDERRSRGIEFLAAGPLGPRLGWSASYSFSESEEAADGIWTPRPHDQRHATQFQLSYSPSDRWTVSGAWRARSGWPASLQTYDVQTLATGDPVIGNFFGEIYGTRLPPYRRLDLRISRRFDLNVGRLFLNLDLFNALNRENPQALEYDLYLFDPYRRSYTFGTELDEQIPRLITLGFRWEF